VQAIVQEIPEASQVVGSFPLSEDFAAPVYNQVHQEQIIATAQAQVINQETPQVPFVEWTQEQLVVIIEVRAQERVEQHTAKQIVHVPISQIQEQSAVTGFVNPQFLNIAVETLQVVGSFPLSEEFAAPTEVTTLNTSSTSTSSDLRLDEFANMFDSCIELLTPLTAQIENIERETERVAMLTKRMMEPPLPEPPMMTEPTLLESERASSKRCRRTRYTPLPGIMENAVFLAPSAWHPTRRA